VKNACEQYLNRDRISKKNKREKEEERRTIRPISLNTQNTQYFIDKLLLV
jgi:hypothetical protein